MVSVLDDHYYNFIMPNTMSYESETSFKYY